jgi:hypothetical protein
MQQACDAYFKLVAFCDRCEDDRAVYSYRLDRENREVISTGGKDDYRVLCRRCFHELMEEPGAEQRWVPKREAVDPDTPPLPVDRSNDREPVICSPQ